jgi:hypothetical protein
MVPSSILRKLVCSLGKTELSSDEIRLVRADCFQMLHVHIFLVAPLCPCDMS